LPDRDGEFAIVIRMVDVLFGEKKIEGDDLRAGAMQLAQHGGVNGSRIRRTSVTLCFEESKRVVVDGENDDARIGFARFRDQSREGVAEEPLAAEECGVERGDGADDGGGERADDCAAE